MNIFIRYPESSYSTPPVCYDEIISCAPGLMSMMVFFVLAERGHAFFVLPVWILFFGLFLLLCAIAPARERKDLKNEGKGRKEKKKKKGKAEKGKGGGVGKRGSPSKHHREEKEKG